jgi:hypothetical protein
MFAVGSNSMKMQTVILGLALCAANGALAQMHRCPMADGRTTYQQLPCDTGAASAPAAAPAAVAADPTPTATPVEPPRPTRRARDVLELTAQLERCRADAPGFAEKSAAVHAAWTRRHAAVLATYEKQLAARVRGSRRGEAGLSLATCTDDWLRGIEPLSRMPDGRFATVEKTWQVFMGALMTGDRSTALNCLDGRVGVRWKARIDTMKDEDLRRIAASIRGLKVQWGDDYEKEGLVADTENRAVAVAFRSINEEWKIVDWGGPAVTAPAP